ncbi:MAG: long-chain fatty acid--CoA ligase [Alphaproteobacteria bacterium]|nr:long-chain fatty acid--CoA ligase [Alphaproteobacteria bacterium]
MTGERPSPGPERRRRGIILTDGIRAAARRTPTKVALAEGSRQLTYRQLIERVDRVSQMAAAFGLPVGARVALLAPNSLEYIEVVCGLAAAAHPVVTIGPNASVPEIEYILGHAETLLLVAHPATEQKARSVRGPHGERVVIIGPDYESRLASVRASPPTAAVSEDDIFTVPYTSGATGRPKGVMLSHRCRILTAFGMAAEHACYSPDDRALATTPMFHGSGFLMAFAPVFFGGFAEILPRFEIEQLLAAAARIKATSVYMVPTHFAAMLALPDHGRRHDIASLKTVFSGTAPLAQAMKEPIIERIGEGRLVERYGSTEASIVTCLRPVDQLRKIQCVGLPFPLTEVRTLDENGEECPVGVVGELYSRSPFMFSGYLKSPEQTAAAYRGEWFSAGDMARRDDEGYVYIVDRKNDMIISGGENIYPREIEEVLLAHPSVAEAAVVGLPHDYWGEAVTAFVVVKTGHDVGREALMALCEEQIARFKLPKEIRFLERLPRNTLGKVLRRELREASKGKP